jgi:integral membrane sensor domain MASE1
MHGPKHFGRGARGGNVPHEALLRRDWNDLPRASALTLSASVALVGVLFGASRLGLSFASSPGGISALWPSSGIAVAAVLLGGRRLLPAIAAGALLTALTRGQPVTEGLSAALAAAGEAALASVLLRRVGFRDSLRRTSDVVAFVGWERSSAPPRRP